MKRLLLILLVLISLISCKKEAEDKKVVEVKKPEPIIIEFGFKLNDFDVVQDTIVSGDNFGNILEKQNIGDKKVHQITERIKDSFNLRNIRIGKPYTMLRTKDASKKLQVFIYQADIANYYVVDLRDSVANAYKKQKPISLKRRTIATEISGSLSETLSKAGVNASMAQNLADIYAYSVDFFKIQKGDKFAVTFTEKYINDTIFAGVESLEASFFEYKGKKIYAFPFKQDTASRKVDYYDEEGKVLKNMFLKAPLKFGYRISSKFSTRRFHPVQQRFKAHNGTDYAAAHGTPIVTTASGVVEKTGYTAGNGNFVKVKHNSTYSTQYLHMSKILVRHGQRVSQGDVIGKVGSTGLATGPHVCYRFWKNGVQVDALRQKLPNSEPMNAKFKPRFMAEMAPLKKELDSIAAIKFKK
ncbi:murein DD-endopeptidase MepM/ murein hydrolase activator NlpD [Flavobacterium arsenatis]|uniref:Murein DD-endopeptidase MepM/ murein hydrolase activator NlpD n=1 Tax=Flavobacterium arsenatis TaxID=1484332 RepID=A0ABU1TTB1_9FLAO|nr:peptidoglycan DD-metalloendopeptidase family protein [Flavobacterium arsenatis]MDR6969120.1 murein DD-endopeptidase MepM/ murein hydrolase activator NlpD [Flavobacterium arsenatis]